ncbi:DUF305 domain-containing protein [Agromyces humatus]|uniref:DUF305 domain-containing protein n=1 Tax=Agromyces humatus TaxID=279573 RepID=A0ABN2KJW9_9MICO
MLTPGFWVAGVAAFVFAAGTLSGCTINFMDADDDRGSRMMGDPGPGGGMTGDSDSDAGGFSPGDIMFARMMIPHHQQAIDMSELALEKSADPDVQALAEQIREAQASEIVIMEGWLDEAGRPRMPMGDGMGMGMGGMLSDAEMTELENATGAEFDRLYLEGMITHHEGAIVMTRMILDSRNPEVRGLGEAIVESQTTEIELMEQMLGR